MQAPAQTLSPSHPWLGQLHSGLDGLAAALLRGDALGTERASAAVQVILQRAPQNHELADAGQALRADILQAAQRFAQLRQTVLRNAAQSQRAVHSLLPQAAPATYGRQIGPAASSTGGAGRAYLAA
jgi:hypothetical protein